MNKKEYQKPAMQLITLQQQAHLLAGSGNASLTSTRTNLGADDFEFVGSDENYGGDAR